MLYLNAADVRSRLRISALVHHLDAAFKADCAAAPPRQVLPIPGKADNRLLIMMPALASTGAAVKLVTYSPDNSDLGLPTIQGVVVLFSHEGTPIAALDAASLTIIRTAAVSALASRYLSRANSRRLVIIGTGALAPYMAEAHCSVRPIRHIAVWGRSRERVAHTIGAIQAAIPNVIVESARSLEQAVSSADIVSSATSSTTAVLQGKWVRPGSLIDLVGSFSPKKREADDDVMIRSRIFVDTCEGALQEAGDILYPLNAGLIQRAQIIGELTDLARGQIPGRIKDDEIITFKSVGTAVSDLAAARLTLFDSGGNFGTEIA